MPKTDEENEVIINTDSESEVEHEASGEPPEAKKNKISAPPSSMPSRRKSSKEKESKDKDDISSTSTAKEVLTPNVLSELIAKLTGGSGHSDSLMSLDRRHISEILLLKRRISQYDLNKSSDVSRELHHINHHADHFADTTDAKKSKT